MGKHHKDVWSAPTETCPFALRALWRCLTFLIPTLNYFCIQCLGALLFCRLLRELSSFQLHEDELNI